MLPRPSVSRSGASGLARVPRALGTLGLLLIVLVAARAIAFRRPHHTIVSARLTGPWLENAGIAVQPPPRTNPLPDGMGATTEKAASTDNAAVVDSSTPTENDTGTDATIAREDAAGGTDATAGSGASANANEAGMGENASAGTADTTSDTAGNMDVAEMDSPAPSMEAEATNTPSATAVLSTAGPNPVPNPEATPEPLPGVKPTDEINSDTSPAAAEPGDPITAASISNVYHNFSFASAVTSKY